MEIPFPQLRGMPDVLIGVLSTVLNLLRHSWTWDQIEGLPISRMSVLSGERNIYELIRPRDDQRQQKMVPDLAKLKCAPCQAEKVKTAFTGDGDGWRSNIISGWVGRFLDCWACSSTGRVLDLLVIPRRRPSLHIPVIGSSLLQPCGFRIRLADPVCSKVGSHPWDHDECTI